MIRKRARLWMFVLLFGFFLFENIEMVQAAQIEDQVNDTNDYSDIQKIIDDSVVSDHTFDFGEYVSNLIQNKDAFSVTNMFAGLKDGIMAEMKGNLSVLGRLIAIAIIAAIFTNFATVFMDNQVAETGFYITYIVLFTIIITSFRTVSSLTITTVDNVLTFVKMLVPTYFLAVTVSTGAASSVIFYEFTLIVISLVNTILIRLVVPAIYVYLIILLADNLSKEDKLSKLAKTLGTGIKWVIRSLVVLVIGFNAIQSLIAPVADGVKRSLFVKMGGAIPGVGNLLSGVTETVLGASLLLKNAIGVAGLIAIILICAMPIVKLIIYYFIYRICESVVQPISDKRIMKCIGACSEAVSMMLQVVIVSAILFIISITIVTVSTTMMY